LDYSAGICGGLEGLAAAAALDGEAQRAAQLLGAAAALHESVGFVLEPDQALVVDPAVDRARTQLGEEAFAATWEAGRALTLEQAIAYALEENDGDSVASIGTTSSTIADTGVGERRPEN
jgi:non-specific serine/threonine protein kinase